MSEGPEEADAPTEPRRRPKIVVGRAELITLPDLGIPHLRARIDSGARGTCLHVVEMRRLGLQRLRFCIALDNGRRRWAEADVVRYARVRSSNGLSNKRPVIRSRFVMGGLEKEIEVSLTKRTGMSFRMLVGRNALSPQYLIDVARAYVASPTLRVRVE